MKTAEPRYSDYDRKAHEAIQRWKNPTLGPIGKIWKAVSKPVDVVGEYIISTKVIGTALKTAAEGLTDICNDIAKWSIRPEAIFADFRMHGYAVHTYEDIAKLDLEQIDNVVGILGTKYTATASFEGGVTGAAGVVGLAVDVPALIVMNLRAIAEYSAYYGIDPRSQQERIFTLGVLAAASTWADSTKSMALGNLAKISKDIAKGRAWKELEKHAFVRLVRQIANALGIRLVKAKLGQIIPLAGAAIGMGANYNFTSRVTDAAYHMYRERFLAEKYGAVVFDVESAQPEKSMSQREAECVDVVDVEVKEPASA